MHIAWFLRFAGLVLCSYWLRRSTAELTAKFPPFRTIGSHLERFERSGTPFRTEPFRTVRKGQIWKASRTHLRSVGP